MRSHLDIKTFIVLVIITGALGIVMARLSYSTKNPLLKKDQPVIDNVQFTFPETEDTNPVKKSESAATPAPVIKKPKEKVCVEAVVSAVNKQTLELRQFTNTCDVPEGWEVLN